MSVLIVYYSRTGNTQRLAEIIRDAVDSAGEQVKLQRIEDTVVDDFAEADAIVIGTPVYYGAMAAEIKKLLDDSNKLHGKLDGKIGGAFASSANIAGGNETAIMGIISAMLIHGMIIQGDPVGDHYGPVAIGKPDGRSEKLARRWGERIVALVRRCGN